jgi:hypothetical protein
MDSTSYQHQVELSLLRSNFLKIQAQIKLFFEPDKINFALLRDET